LVNSTNDLKEYFKKAKESVRLDSKIIEISDDFLRYYCDLLIQYKLPNRVDLDLKDILFDYDVEEISDKKFEVKRKFTGALVSIKKNVFDMVELLENWGDLDLVKLKKVSGKLWVDVAFALGIRDFMVNSVWLDGSAKKFNFTVEEMVSELEKEFSVSKLEICKILTNYEKENIN